MARDLVPTKRQDVALREANPKAENFKRLATQRTAQVIEELRKLANLSNRNNYVFTDAEVDHIYKTIAREMVMGRRKFTPGFKTFSFDDM